MKNVSPTFFCEIHSLLPFLQFQAEKVRFPLLTLIFIIIYLKNTKFINISCCAGGGGSRLVE